MTAQILNGKDIAQQIRTQLKQKISALPSAPKLAIIQAGNNPASSLYVRNKLKAAAETGIETEFYHLAETVSEHEITALIRELNNNDAVHCIMVQLPLPGHLPEASLLEMVKPEKDVDGFHPCNIGLLQNENSKGVIAATPKGIMRLLEHTGIDLAGKNAIVIGRSKIVGRPAAMLLLQKDCTVTIAHSKTTNLPELVKNADIVVAACGCAELVKSSWIKENAILIDVGINHKDGRLCGDIDFASALEKAAFITPVPGGVGPMTIAMLLENAYLAYLKQNNC